MGWRVAKSLGVLRAQINDAWPSRSKASDGTVSSTTHRQQNPNSDHDPNADGVVTAFDCTHDPGSGADMRQMCAALIASRDPRIKYVIWDRRIWRSYPKPGVPAWTPQSYSGSNPHTKHLHVSVQPDKRLYDSEAPWSIHNTAGAPTASGDAQEEDMPSIEEIRAVVREEVAAGVGELERRIADRHLPPRDKLLTELVGHARADASRDREAVQVSAEAVADELAERLQGK